MKAKKTYLMTCHIAGLQYYDALEVWSDLKTGLELSIEPELDNKFDRHALAVKWKDAKLGYIPRGENRHMAKILKAGWNPYQVLIESIYDDRPMNERIELCVRILDKEE
ncbi:MAG: HIRAN domain-containing protein [Flavobacteriales bacterium]|nr:HIRAN domain-containing protein [Flavobacteriales bacterium]MBL6872987.1 HIRAN domain-containing protein [Flavobacteriales bacterium]